MGFMWVGALVVGLMVGLLGAGGSILTVPILVYGVGEVEKVAIAESLAIVGTVALAGAIRFSMTGQVSWRMVLLFGLPGMAGAYLGAALARHVPGSAQLGLFAVLMLVASALMLRPPALAPSTAAAPRRAYWKVLIDGLALGMVTGLVGVGGGFLIVPALVLLGGLPMHKAVGTSLAIIPLNSFTGYLKYLDVLSSLHYEVNWGLIGLFAGFGAIGSFAGHALSGRVPARRLQQGFAVFLLAISGYILYRNVPRIVG